jgi:hypothetical protein
VGHCAGAKQKRKIFQPISLSFNESDFFFTQSCVLLFRASSKRLIRCFLYILSFQSGTMPPAVIFLESDYEVQIYHRPDDELPGGENWDEELLVPGGMVYVGQGQMQFLRIDEVDPGLMWPKRRPKKKKKKKTKPQLHPSPAPPSPATEPAPIDWGDWEELCQAAPPLPPSPPVPAPPPAPWEPEDWDAEIAASQWEPEIVPPWEPEDWDAEIAASQWEPEDVPPPWQPEDWDAEIAASQWEPEDWDAEISASQWEPEDWEAELSQ